MAGDLTREGSKVITQEDKTLLSERVQLLKRANAFLVQENSIMLSMFERLDPWVLEPQPEGEDLGGMGGVSPMEVVLTLEQKCYVGQRETEETLKDLEKVKRTQEKDSEVEKLGRKNGVLKAQVRKLQLQLRRKAQMEEGMTEFDLRQLKIENGQCLEQIDKQNQELSQLKLLAVNKQQALSSYKKKLQNMTYESQQLSSDITNRMEMLEKMEKEFLQVEEERSKAESLTRKLRDQMGTDVPNILDYIQVIDKHGKLERGVRTMERKVKIAEMALKTQRRAWDKQRAVVAAMDVDTSSHNAGPGAAQLRTAQKTHAKAWNKQDGAGAGARAKEGQLKLRSPRTKP